MRKRLLAGIYFYADDLFMSCAEMSSSCLKTQASHASVLQRDSRLAIFFYLVSIHVHSVRFALIRCLTLSFSSLYCLMSTVCISLGKCQYWVKKERGGRCGLNVVQRKHCRASSCRPAKELYSWLVIPVFLVAFQSIFYFQFWIICSWFKGLEVSLVLWHPKVLFSQVFADKHGWVFM